MVLLTRRASACSGIEEGEGGGSRGVGEFAATIARTPPVADDRVGGSWWCSSKEDKRDTSAAAARDREGPAGSAPGAGRLREPSDRALGGASEGP
jgi:hypothetical protein